MLRTAARRVFERGAPEAAVRLLGRALEEPIVPDERAAVLLEFGLAEFTAGQQEGANEHLSEVAHCADDLLLRTRAVAMLTHVGVPDPGHGRAHAPMLDAA